MTSERDVHPDEGTIHAWLDRQLDDASSSALEAHLQRCDECAERVAEARGLIAGASRIIASLDDPSSAIADGTVPRDRAGAPESGAAPFEGARPHAHGALPRRPPHARALGHRCGARRGRGARHRQRAPASDVAAARARRDAPSRRQRCLRWPSCRLVAPGTPTAAGASVATMRHDRRDACRVAAPHLRQGAARNGGERRPRAGGTGAARPPGRRPWSRRSLPRKAADRRGRRDAHGRRRTRRCLARSGGVGGVERAPAQCGAVARWRLRSAIGWRARRVPRRRGDDVALPFVLALDAPATRDTARVLTADGKPSNVRAVFERRGGDSLLFTMRRIGYTGTLAMGEPGAVRAGVMRSAPPSCRWSRPS